ncbi:hypothetical protein BKA58DRAFT_200507 [Alternaria rosae]|uniref:uncharacterized protein n=1 Tax=Alternaria rosae TaxID=1187941 RepID=UPI001E8DE77A|nr:uncharacterized protein BKA58DRAFT_200507 [Alternaria rosae]KAH6868767.1 hypothetical protein BKA58DRAFT_200507 [Alternaria rosae]
MDRYGLSENPNRLLQTRAGARRTQYLLASSALGNLQKRVPLATGLRERSLQYKSACGYLDANNVVGRRDGRTYTSGLYPEDVGKLEWSGQIRRMQAYLKVRAYPKVRCKSEARGGTLGRQQPGRWKRKQKKTGQREGWKDVLPPPPRPFHSLLHPPICTMAKTSGDMRIRVPVSNIAMDHAVCQKNFRRSLHIAGIFHSHLPEQGDTGGGDTANRFPC